VKPSTIYIKDFNYELPEDRIAKYPLEKRSASKLLFYKKGNIEHRNFLDLGGLLPEKSMLIFNNTKVIHARLHFRKETGAEVEVFLLNPLNHENAGTVLNRKGSSVWHCLIGNKKRFKQEDVLQKGDLSALWMDRENDVIEFNYGDKSFAEVIEQAGSLPIPPYLNRPTEEVDNSRYQTTFAVNRGSVAAPTAALHFDEEINQRLVEKGIQYGFITLHVGAGTFKPVSAENAMEHTMHEEYIVFKKEFIQSFLQHSHSKIAVGTTSFRSLESLYWFGVGLQRSKLDHFHIPQYFPYNVDADQCSVEESLTTILNWMEENGLETLEGTSSIYIVPGYKPRMIEGLVTNFHQPQSTLLLLIAALVGDDWKKIYEEALKRNYRFLSYGDSSLILF
jgi:S-adenosylmethionine:tRNA ribosyltransferase-isomerase